MKILERTQGNVGIITPKGRIDSISSSVLEEKIETLLKKKVKMILINFSETDYVSSAGLRILLWQAKQIANINGKIVLTDMNADVQNAFDISGFSQVFTIFASEALALEALS